MKESTGREGGTRGQYYFERTRLDKAQIWPQQFRKLLIDCCFFMHQLRKGGGILVSACPVCVRSFKNFKARVSNFHICIPKKIAVQYFFLVRIISLGGVMPLLRDQSAIS